MVAANETSRESKKRAAPESSKRSEGSKRANARKEGKTKAESATIKTSKSAETIVIAECATKVEANEEPPIEKRSRNSRASNSAASVGDNEEIAATASNRLTTPIEPKKQAESLTPAASEQVTETTSAQVNDDDEAKEFSAAANGSTTTSAREARSPMRNHLLQFSRPRWLVGDSQQQRDSEVAVNFEADETSDTTTVAADDDASTLRLATSLRRNSTMRPLSVDVDPSSIVAAALSSSRHSTATSALPTSAVATSAPLAARADFPTTSGVAGHDLSSIFAQITQLATRNQKNEAASATIDRLLSVELERTAEMHRLSQLQSLVASPALGHVGALASSALAARDNAALKSAVKALDLQPPSQQQSALSAAYRRACEMTTALQDADLTTAAGDVPPIARLTLPGQILDSDGGVEMRVDALTLLLLEPTALIGADGGVEQLEALHMPTLLLLIEALSVVQPLRVAVLEVCRRFSVDAWAALRTVRPRLQTLVRRLLDERQTEFERLQSNHRVNARLFATLVNAPTLSTQLAELSSPAADGDRSAAALRVAPAQLVALLQLALSRARLADDLAAYRLYEHLQQQLNEAPDAQSVLASVGDTSATTSIGLPRNARALLPLFFSAAQQTQLQQLHALQSQQLALQQQQECAQVSERVKSGGSKLKAIAHRTTRTPPTETKSIKSLVDELCSRASPIKTL